MEIRLIWAMERDGGIGRDNRLPWSYPRDLRRFRERTMGYPVLMGRKTFQSLPSGPLPGRTNLVLSRSGKGGPDSPELWFDSPDAVLSAGGERGWKKLYVIGGEEIFRLFLERADYLEVTRIHRSYPCDRFFPEIDWGQWTLISSEGEGELSFEIYVSTRTR